MKFTKLFTALGVLAFVLFAQVAKAATPRAGEKAPIVEGKNQDGKTWKLSDSLGKKIVLLYFYPKDNTPGCTKEACGLRDRMTDLKKDSVEVIGVSFDSAESHQKFIKQYDLNFPLLADTERCSPRTRKKHGSPGQFSDRQRRKNCPCHRQRERGCASGRDEGSHRDIDEKIVWAVARFLRYARSCPATFDLPSNPLPHVSGCNQAKLLPAEKISRKFFFPQKLNIGRAE